VNSVWAKTKMQGQLVAGQWVEVSMEHLATPVQLNGFVLSLRPSEVLLTFPELLTPPCGLESEGQATFRYSNQSGAHTATGHIVRVASGPPVTVTFERLASVDRGQKRSPLPAFANLPVSVQVVTSSVASSIGRQDGRGCTQKLNADGMLLETTLLLAVGDVLRLVVTAGHGRAGRLLHGRVVRSFELEPKNERPLGVGVEFFHETESDRAAWLQFAAEFQGQARR
jgi:hypothetical protein